MSNKLESISVSGFKSIRELKDFKLGDLNVLVGANGSGKSNFIGLFRMLFEMFDGKFQNYAASSGQSQSIFHFGRKVTTDMSLELSFPPNGFSAKIGAADDGSLFFKEADFIYDGHVASRYSAYSADKRELDFGRVVSSMVKEYVVSNINTWHIYHFHDTGKSAKVKGLSDVGDNKRLHEDARNLASYLYLLKEKHPYEYKIIVDQVQRVAPFFQDFILEPDRSDTTKIRLVWKHKKSDDYFTASALSDGTLRFICLMTALYQPEAFRPSMILIDEPELGLHPHAISLLANIFEVVSKEVQLIVSTQSITLLNQFQASDVVVVDSRDGISTFTRLSEEKMSGWLDDFALGDLLEKNVFGGTPRY